MFFLYTGLYTKENTERGKIVRIRVRTTSYKPSMLIISNDVLYELD